MQKLFFVFDVESIGLHGQGYAVGGGLYDLSTPILSTLSDFRFACPQNVCRGSAADRQWVEANIAPIPATHEWPSQIRTAFWEQWEIARDMGAMMAADCPWPVEARFLISCVEDNVDRDQKGPYPLIDVSSVLLSAGLDPLATHDRLESELPVHDPLADARQSARLLLNALNQSTPIHNTP